MIFLRHPVPNAMPGLCYGRMDLDLGPDAAAQIVKASQSIPVGHLVITSPAQRCVALADVLAARDGCVPVRDKRLWEMNFGRWEGLMWEDIPRAESDPWAEDCWNLAPPGGERFADVCARVKAAISDAPEDAIIVTHAGVIRAAKIVLLGTNFQEVFDEQIPYAKPIQINRIAA